MKSDDRIEGLLDDLDETVRDAAQLVARGRDAFDSDLAVRLAFGALSNRIGEVTKQLVNLDPERFAEPDWSSASRHRDKIVHHYRSIDREILWATMSERFPQLGELAQSKRAV